MEGRFLFIHGTASSGRIWLKMLKEMPCVPNLPGGTIAPDLPGMGGPAITSGLDGSRARGTMSALSFADWVEYLKGVVAAGFAGDSADSENSASFTNRVHVVGHSLGGALAMTLAGEDWVESVALISPATAAFCREMRRMSRPGRRPGSIQFRRVSGSLVYDPLTLTRDDAVMLREDYERAGPLLEGGLPWPDFDVDEARLLAGRRTLVVWGEEDKVVPPAYALEISDRLRASGIPVVSASIANCGHVPMLERPGELARILHDFWNR